MSKNRLEVFSDGVFAIILTLLVLELHVPEVADHSSLSQYAQAMAPLIPKVVTMALTFVLICVHWVSHHYFFQQIERITIEFVWLNNLFLLWICFMPFPTALLGDHLTDQFPILVYAVNQLLAALTFFVIRTYTKNHQLIVDDAAAKAMGPRHSVPAIIILVLSILFAFVNAYLSLACFLLVPLLYFIPTVIQKKMR
ncbi:MAG TPA: TMEM175 family protein [Anaerolineales bacterium]|nr:TMEM175 family protein [Anaerolineales bacterium]